MLLILILAVFFLLLAIFYASSFSFNQFHLLLVSSKVSNSKLLYTEVFDYLAPLPIYFNALLNGIGSNSLLISEIAGFFLILFNSLFFNNLVDKYRLIEERTFVPGFIYLLFSSSIFTGFEFSPLLLASTFLLLATSSMLGIGKENSDKMKSSFTAGIYVGMAFICEQSMILFLCLGISASFYYSSKVFKTVLPFILGFTFPFIVLLNIYLFNDAHSSFFNYFITQYFFGEVLFYLPLVTLTPWLVITIFFLFLYFPVKLRFSFTNYVSKAHQIFVIWVVISFIISFFIKERSYDVIHIFTGPVAFVISFYFLNLRKRWLAEFYVFVIILFSFCFNYIDVFDINDKGVINTRKVESKYDGNSLLLSNDIHFYTVNNHASAFTNWELEKRAFLNINKKENTTKVYEGIVNDYPKYIIDPDGIFDRVVEVIPLFKEKYRKVDSKTFRLNDSK